MRWHAPTCHQPDVYVAEDGFPACRRCGKSAQDMRHLRKNQLSSLEPLPPDEPEGRLSLWWPSSVPYTSNISPTDINHDAKENSSELPSSGVKSDIPEASVAPPTSPASHENGHIYERPLMPNEFRLAYLSALPDRSDTSHPIHLSFCVVDYDHHPDYDTVSYAWGGEDNNRDHNSPIYIGDYWDVLHATRNCWAVLRYLRPWRGIRLVWLDFLCINQRDMNEKAQQISKMGQIYSNCSQVFLWLGEDAVSHDQAVLPSRRPFEGLQGLHQILSRNYFTRVWVVQELVLSPRISMPCGNTVFEVHPQSLGNMEHALTASPAPWLNLATRGSSHNQTWAEVMSMTSRSKSSDARDGLYGVLGLWASGSRLPIPSYEISYQHMMIGMFAWLLVHEHDLSVLLAARCVSLSDDGDTSPSWLPPWKKHDFWQWFIKTCSQDQITHHPEWNYKGTDRRVDELEPSHIRDGWHQSQITVDPNTGGLSLRAIKIKDVQSGLRKVENDRFAVPHFHKWVSECGLYVRTCKDIEGVVKEGDELYLLIPVTPDHHDQRVPQVYLFLRKVANEMHKLVLCVPMVCFDDSDDDSFKARQESLEDTRKDRSLALDVIEEIWDLPMYKFDEGMSTGGARGRDLHKMFPGNENTPFHALLSAILHDYDFHRLLDNDTAPRYRAHIVATGKSTSPFAGLGEPERFLAFRFSRPDWEAIEDVYTADRETKHLQLAQFRCSEGNVRGIYSWKCWEIPEELRQKESLFISCPIHLVQKLLHMIDKDLCITSVWKSVGIRSPKGSREELRYARTVYPSRKDSRDYEKRNNDYNWRRAGNSIVMGVESRVHIV